jgi:4-amino-4-deoxy-L-arabinose transferase-like glycosyltransferase
MGVKSGSTDSKRLALNPGTHNWSWLLPVIAAIFLLLYRLSDVAGLHRDEATFGLLAEQIQNGLRPVCGYFNVYTSPIHSYIIALFFELFGESIWSLRCNGVLTNLIAVGLYVDIVRRLFPRQAFWTLWILVTLPAFVVMTRISGENYALNPLFLFAGIWCYYVMGIHGKHRWLSRLGYALTGLFLYLDIWNHIITLPTVAAISYTYLWFERKNIRELLKSLLWFIPGTALGLMPKIYGIVVLDYDWLPTAPSSGVPPFSEALGVSFSEAFLNFVYTLGGDALYLRACGEVLLSFNWFLPLCLIASASICFRPKIPKMQRMAWLFVAACTSLSFVGSCLITPKGLIGSRIWLLPMWFVPLLLALSLPNSTKTLRIVIGSVIIGVNVASIGVNYFYNFLQDGGIPRAQVYVGGRTDNSWDFIDIRPLVKKLSTHNDKLIYIEDGDNHRLIFLLPRHSRQRARTLRDLKKGAIVPVNSLFSYYKSEDRMLPLTMWAGGRCIVKKPGLCTSHFDVYEAR